MTGGGGEEGGKNSPSRLTVCMVVLGPRRRDEAFQGLESGPVEEIRAANSHEPG